MDLGKETYLAAVERDGLALGAAARSDLAADVPSCPGWTQARLAGHMGRVYRSITEHVVRRATEPVPREEIAQPPEGAAVMDYFEEGHRMVLDALEAVDVDEPVWTWTERRDAGFYHRRMAHETAVHRWDAERAVGEPTPVPSDLGADGCDEMLTSVLPARAADLPSGSLHVHRTDGHGEWLVVADGGQMIVTREHAKGDAAVRAPGSDLVLLVWGRLPVTAPGVELFGDAAVAEAWFSVG